MSVSDGNISLRNLKKKEWMLSLYFSLQQKKTVATLYMEL